MSGLRLQERLVNCLFTCHFFLPDREWIERTIARNDKDGDGGINLQEFIDMNIKGKLKNSLTNQSAGATAIGNTSIIEKAKLAFNAYDRNRDGYLTKAELRKTSKRMTDAQIDAVFEKYDKNKDGKLDFEEFKDLMENNSKNKAAAAAAANAAAASAASAASSSRRRSTSNSPQAGSGSASSHDDEHQ